MDNKELMNQIPRGVKRWSNILLIGIGAIIFGYYRAEIWDTVWTAAKVLTVLGIMAGVWITSPLWKRLLKNFYKAMQYTFIKMDPLSNMDRYAELLRTKLRNLKKGKVSIQAELVETDNQIEEDKTTMQKNLKLGIAAKEVNNLKQASFFGTEARNAEESIKLAMPGREKLSSSVKFLTDLGENWEITIKGIESFNARKRRDYKRLKKNAAVLGQSKEFLDGNTPEAQDYQLAVRAANERMAQWAADVADFEEKAKPILERGNIERRMHENEGLDMLQQYADKLMLPDFNSLEIKAQDIDYELVSSSTPGTSSFKSLLNN